ncbi:hypothetical protein [Polaribacter cellanae]|uniref:Uncharacterized protein n=1 Tax=Polaribacter cellanae TaxID=2818493 RepID=A0A975CLI7_9FLAO|nr:hypothetical protein [Polaribacter cellanae]QTE21514.1 hypothetical protein J3359_11845 [Polaribacter cellanae]
MIRSGITESVKLVTVRGSGPIRIQTRLCNSCGCSDWKEQTFGVKWTSSGGGGIFGF